ncbi:MAG: four helix bundle protein [Prevotella sp.]|nr:four helix bundle protein [Prevotella sp.]
MQDLSYDFACRIIRLFQYLTEDSIYKEYIISKQVFRSGTSIGANIREAQHAQSDADFLSKMQISLKECNETEYWLQLLHDNGYLNDVQYSSINTDRVRIHKLLNAIVSTTRRKIGK